MKTKFELELVDVKRIAAAAEAEALKNQWAVTIAIVDDGGHLLWLQRLDGAPAISSHIAPAKAHTAALGRRESKVYEDVINGGRTSFLSAPAVAGMLEGGVPILKDGQCLGAVGVSGVKSSEDAQIARAGVAATGLEKPKPCQWHAPTKNRPLGRFFVGETKIAGKKSLATRDQPLAGKNDPCGLLMSPGVAPR